METMIGRTMIGRTMIGRTMIGWWCAAVLAVEMRRDERGDVPGWVLITVMTAGLVTVLWAVAGDVLSQMLSDALRSVAS